jgi:catechol 2,3-dioxygenase-like lactoylglutathione lyase family enzyme
VISIRIDHYSIRTTRLEECRRFYGGVLGLREGPRPPFKFPGIWFYAGEASVVHIVGLDPTNPRATLDYLGERPGASSTGGGTIDHIAFAAKGLQEMRALLTRHGVAFQERTIPSLGLHQVFVLDPNDVTLEFNYASSEKSDQPPG